MENFYLGALKAPILQGGEDVNEISTWEPEQE